MSAPHQAGIYNTAERIAHAGEKIYDEKYRLDFEREHNGQFAAIDVYTGDAYIADRPEDALRKARKSAPTGIFHLVRVGSPTAYTVSR